MIGDEAVPKGALREAIEAVLIVSPNPVSPQVLAEATGASLQAVLHELAELKDDFDGAGGTRRGFSLREINGQWRLYSRSEWAAIVGRFVTGDTMVSLSQAALETLAIIAYRQPITRAQISRIRGVSVDPVVRTLLARGLADEVGLTDAGAQLLATTDLFLEKMGFTSLRDLPPLGPHVAGPEEANALAEELP